MPKSKITIVSRYRTSDGQEHETEYQAASHQRILDWRDTFTEVEDWDPTTTVTLYEFASEVEQLRLTHGDKAEIQFRANDMGDVSAYVREKGSDV